MKSVFHILGLTVLLHTASAQPSSPKSRQHYLDEVNYYSEKIAKEPENITHYFLRGTFNHILTNFYASTIDFKTVIDIYSKNPIKKYAGVATDACYYLADDYYFRNADRPNAQFYIDKGLSISPGDKRFEFLKTSILGSYPEKAAEASAKFESLIAKYPFDEKLALYYARFLQRTDPAKSMVYFEKVIAVNPYNTEALFALGSYYSNEGSRIFKTTGDARKAMELTNRAIAYFEIIHGLKPDDREIVEILIQCCQNIGLDAERRKWEKKLSASPAKNGITR